MNREKANKMHTTIRFFKEMFPDEFEKTDIICCHKCNGIGFTDTNFHNNSICGNCTGIGFLGFEKIGLISIVYLTNVNLRSISLKQSVRKHMKNGLIKL